MSFLDKLLVFQELVLATNTNPRSRREFPGSITDDPEVDVKTPSLQVWRDDIRLRKLETINSKHIFPYSLNSGVSRSVGVGRLNDITRSISEHPVTRHLDIEGVRLSISLPGLREDPLDSLSTTGETLNTLTILRVDESLRVAVPVELNPLLVLHSLGNSDGDAEPVGAP